MKVHQSKSTFEDRLQQEGLSLGHLSLSDGFDRMVSFYRDVVAEDCPRASLADMLLYQWGKDRRSGDFRLSITRQFALAQRRGEENIYQLALEFDFAETDDPGVLGSGSKWCGARWKIWLFTRFIRRSQAYLQFASLAPAAVRLTLDKT